MDRPANIEDPFFAYGLFRPGQLGFFQLKDLVHEITPATAKGILLLRDGLPIIDPNGEGKVSGALLTFSTSRAAEEAYDRISALEPEKHYRWGQAQVNGTTANILFGRSPHKGSDPCEEKDWDGWSDPLFTAALEVIDESLQKDQKIGWDLKPLFRLQMAYLLLWSAIERYVSLRYHLGQNVMEKVSRLADESAFASGVARHVSGRRELYRADQPKKKNWCLILGLPILRKLLTTTTKSVPTSLTAVKVL